MAKSDREVLGARGGMVPFPSPSAGAAYDEMGSQAIRLALADGGIDYADVEQAYAGYVYGDSCCGQRVAYQVGLTGIPVFNVNKNCSTGSTALYLARQAIASGAADCAIAVGFEQMTPGALGATFTDRPNPFIDFDTVTDALVDIELPLPSDISAERGFRTCGNMARPWRILPRSATRRAVTP